MKKKKLVKVLENKKIAQDIFSMWITAGEMADEAIPGQFVMLYCRDQSRKLGRPISICEIDKEQKRLRMVYRISGKGTEEFSKLKADEEITVLGPLGNGYDIQAEHTVLVAGGIGVPPMLELAKSLPGKKTIVLGYRNSDMFLKEQFEKYGEVYIATDDGSAGIKGNVIDALKQHNIKGDAICACGPMVMLKALGNYAQDNGIDAWFSLEEKMACGIGVCLGCAVPIKSEDGWVYKRVCKDGPVFNSKEIVFDEI